MGKCKKCCLRGHTGPAVDINTNGHVENISITLDGSNSEFFDLHIMLPMG